MSNRVVKLLCILFLLGISDLSNAQSIDSIAQDNKLVPLPTISLNVGFNHGFTDVKLTNGPTPLQQIGYQLTVTQKATKFLNVSLELFSGSLYGEEQRGITNINYRTSLFSQHINVEYNFYPLIKPKENGRQLIQPYLGFGVGAVFFRSKGDLKDKSGRNYNYWTDGNIYAEPEGTIDVSEATPLTRDLEYETDLRDADLDGFRKYSQTAFTMPFNAGIRFQVSKHVGLNASFAYVVNFTDLIDNTNISSVGSRAGNSGFDNHLFGSIGLTVFLGNIRASVKPAKNQEESVASELAPSLSDQLVKTDAENDVTTTERNGPQETDTSSIDAGISDNESMDVEITDPNINATKEPSNVGNVGLTAAEAEPSSNDASNQKSSSINFENLANSSPKETSNFHWADLNDNGWISPDEVLYFIDLLFEGEAVRTVSDIQELIDYYFDQE